MDCLHPIMLTGGRLVPCGRCPRCRKNRQRDWTFRLSAEREACDFFYWLTLTIAPEYMDYDTATGINCLSREKPRHFFESLRKHFGNRVTFKHFLVSEYGDETNRPHFHCLLFCYVPGNNMAAKMRLRKEIREYICGEKSTAWPYGFCYNKPYHDGVFPYITNYVNKPELIDPEHPHPVKPFTCISQGIGISMMERFDLAQFSDLDFRVSYQGKNKILPRYYRDKVFPHSKMEFEKALADGEHELANQIFENAMAWNSKLDEQVYPAKYADATKRMQRYEREHFIDYARYLKGCAAHEEAEYNKQLLKRKRL